MLFRKEKWALKLLAVVAMACALLLALAALFAERVAVTPLAADEFKVSKTDNVRFVRVPKGLREAAEKGLPLKLWIEGELAIEAASVDALATANGPTYRVKADTMLYINDALHGKMKPGAVVLAADLPGKLFDWSRMALALSSLLVLFWLLGLFMPKDSVVGDTGKGRLVALDSLRGIAALTVMLGHAAGMFMPGHWLFEAVPSPGWEAVPALANFVRNSPLAILLNGSLMVHLFWVMSGLVLSAPLLRSESSLRTAQSAAKRYFRLLPLAFVTTMASYFLHVASWYSVEEFNSSTRFGVAMLVFAGGSELSLATALKDALLFGSSFNMPLWTIKYEFLGSLFLFGLVACTLPLKRRRLVWGACLTVLAFIPDAFYLADFVAGLLLADVLLIRGEGPSLGKWASVGLGVLAWSLGATSSGWLTEWVRQIPGGDNIVFKLLPAILFVLLALRSVTVESLLKMRPLIWLGERSFALYVVHALTIHLVGHGVAVVCVRQGIPPLTSSAIGFTAFLIATLWISDWLTKTVDIPSMNAANFVGRWIAGEPVKSGPRSEVVGDASGKVRSNNVIPRSEESEPPAQVC